MNASPSAETTDGPARGPLDVLIVEDSPVVAQRVAELVSELPGTRVVGIAPTEARARQLLREHHPRVMILDLRLAQGTGFGVLRSLLPGEPRPIVIVLSSYSVPEYRNQAELLGVDHFLDKAAEFHRLPGLIASLLPGAPSREEPPAS